MTPKLPATVLSSFLQAVLTAAAGLFFMTLISLPLWVLAVYFTVSVIPSTALAVTKWRKGQEFGSITTGDVVTMAVAIGFVIATVLVVVLRPTS